MSGYGTRPDQVRLDKLPRVIKDYIAMLELKVSRLEDRLTEAYEHINNERTESNTIGAPYAEHPVYLDDYEAVEFRLGTKYSSIRARIFTDHTGQHYLDLNGDRGLIVEPNANNSIRIFQKD